MHTTKVSLGGEAFVREVFEGEVFAGPPPGLAKSLPYKVSINFSKCML
jgi:hypothetical protein